jgi:hypothetical protein
LIFIVVKILQKNYKDTLLFEEWSPVSLVTKLNLLLSKSTEHSGILKIKEEEEQLAQTLHNTLWNFQQEQRMVQGRCGENNMVSYR